MTEAYGLLVLNDADQAVAKLEVGLVLERADSTLFDWVRVARPAPRRVLDVFVQLCRGLVALHSIYRVVDAGFKPSSVLVW